MATISDYAALLQDLQHRADGAIKTLNKDFSGLQTSRISSALLEPIVISVYGSDMHINALATMSVSSSDSSTLNVQVHDKSNVKAIEKAIVAANLGITCSSNGQCIYVTIPAPSEERRKELVKLAHMCAEHSRVAVRAVRHHVLDALKKNEKPWQLSEDDIKRYKTEIQKIVDEYIKKVDTHLQQKEKEIMAV